MFEEQVGVGHWCKSGECHWCKSGEHWCRSDGHWHKSNGHVFAFPTCLWISEILFASIFIGFPPICIGSLVLEISISFLVSWVVCPWLVTVLVLGSRLRHVWFRGLFFRSYRFLVPRTIGFPFVFMGCLPMVRNVPLVFDIRFRVCFHNYQIVFPFLSVFSLSENRFRFYFGKRFYPQMIRVTDDRSTAERF